MCLYLGSYKQHFAALAFFWKSTFKGDISRWALAVIRTFITPFYNYGPGPTLFDISMKLWVHQSRRWVGVMILEASKFISPERPCFEVKSLGYNWICYLHIALALVDCFGCFVFFVFFVVFFVVVFFVVVVVVVVVVVLFDLGTSSSQPSCQMGNAAKSAKAAASGMTKSVWWP